MSLVGNPIVIWQAITRLALAAILAVTMLVPPTIIAVNADTGDRTLYLYETHTHETARITFKRNGVYDKKGLAQLNYFLRDWRNNEVTTMAPQLFDLAWEVYQKVGATQPINIVSAYRSPKTNGFLRTRSANTGVAKHSQHMLGHAMDFFIPGVPLQKLRETVMVQQVGGIGYYPRSGSPFVHMDVGSVRAWPRMSAAQLRKVFPKGKTLHLPATGGPLSVSGRKYAELQWNQCHAVPCSNPAALTSGGRNNIIFSGDQIVHRGKDTPTLVAAIPSSEAQPLLTAQAAPIPHIRPATLVADIKAPGTQAPEPIMLASLSPPVPYREAVSAPVVAKRNTVPLDTPIPARKSLAMMLATATPPPATPGQDNRAVMAIASLEAPIPAPRPSPSPTMSTGQLAMVNAYAPPTRAPAPDAERALQMLISRGTTAGTARLQTAAAQGPDYQHRLNSLVQGTWTAVRNAGTDAPAAAELRRYQPMQSFRSRDVRFVAPLLNDALVRPAGMTSLTFAKLVEPSHGDLNSATELGSMVNRLGFRRNGAITSSTSHFVTTAPLIIASR